MVVVTYKYTKKYDSFQYYVINIVTPLTLPSRGETGFASLLEEGLREVTKLNVNV